MKPSDHGKIDGECPVCGPCITTFSFDAELMCKNCFGPATPVGWDGAPIIVRIETPQQNRPDIHHEEGDIDE